MNRTKPKTPISLLGRAIRSRGWLSSRLLRLAGAVLLTLVALGCAQSVGDIDRTQPNLLKKSDFTGDWYVRQTVIGVPLTSGFSFVGESGKLEIINWQIREDMLVGYRAYESIPGAGLDAESSPIVAYPIMSHVDVQREYNAQTGEQTNVISENTTDRPWNERDYMRVDWSSPQVTNFEFISSPSDMRVEGSSFVNENENDEDKFYTETDGQGRIDYFDFTERLIVAPEINGCILNLFNNDVGDCTSAEIRVRSSFAKVDEAREATYAPLDYDDFRQGEFGAFRTERPSYDRRRGVTYTGLSLLANRHDFWEASLDNEGELIPYDERSLRPVIYHLSPDFPADLVTVTEFIADEFDQSFKQVMAARLEQSVEEIGAQLEERYGQSCLFCLDPNEDGEKRLGDLRYSFIAWVDDPQLRGPLGYGPSSPNPETGRIVSGMAYVYGAGVDTYAQRAKDMVDLINGELVVEDVVNPNFIRDEVINRRPLLTDGERERLSDLPVEDAFSSILDMAKLQSLDDVRAGNLPQAAPGHLSRQLSKLQGTDLEAKLMDSEWLKGLAPHHGLDPHDHFDDDEFALLSPFQNPDTTSLSLQQDKQRRAERNNLWLQDYNDPAVIGLAIALADAGIEGEELYVLLRELIYRAVMLHEIGHTVGLRHNFGGSADPLNYHSEYWDQRVSTLRTVETVDDLLLMNCTEFNDENEDACAAQILGGMSEFQYSSIMDYGGKFNSDFWGLGRYDNSALASIYGNLREVLSDDAAAALPDGFGALLSDVADLSNPLQGSLYDAIHYTDIPLIFGDIDAVNDRRWVPREDVEADPEDYVLVPYLACYDEYVDTMELCHRWDQGADAFEITTNWIRAYQDYYPFYALSRDQIGFSPVATFQRLALRYFLPIQNMYQHGLFTLSFTADPLIATYSSLHMSAGFNQLARVLTTPRYGTYSLDTDANVYRWVSYDATDGDIYLPPGAGRRQFSRTDASAGHSAPTRVAEAGYYWDQLAALLALTSNDASLLGVGQDVQADLLSYSIPYYLMFQPQLDSLFADVFLETTLGIGPYVDGGFVSQRGLFDLDDPRLTRPADAIPIEVSVPWSTRIRSAVFAMSAFKVNFDLTYLQGAQVALEGSGDVMTVAPGFVTAQYADPLTGRVYNSYFDPANVPDQRYVAAELMAFLTLVANDYNALPDGEERDALRPILQDGAESLEILRGLYDVFQYAL